MTKYEIDWAAIAKRYAELNAELEAALVENARANELLREEVKMAAKYRPWREVVEAFLARERGEVRTRRNASGISSLSLINDNLYSYRTPIARWGYQSDGGMIVNTRYYSATTSKQQRYLIMRLEQEGIPYKLTRGSRDLRVEALAALEPPVEEPLVKPKREEPPATRSTRDTINAPDASSDPAPSARRTRDVINAPDATPNARGTRGRRKL